MSELNNSLLNEAFEQFVESPYKFTEPVRYFKSNDPYYWEVDNIPIKQLEENILFLRDQVANNLSVSGIGRKELSELRPFVNGSDRIVYVNPGRFSARINDAYQKGINNFTQESNIDFVNGEADSAIRKKRAFRVSPNTLKSIVGDITTDPTLDNGLFHFLQHHNSEKLNSLDFRWSSTNDNSINSDATIEGLPKNKIAVWRAYGNNAGSTAVSLRNDLQQEAVEFTRFWGGAVRTAIVDVPETLSITIPEFDATEFSNNSASEPSTRIDLLFIYSHPMDASSTTIAKPSGTVPTTITAPRLGLLKGAGLIGIKNGEGEFETFADTDNFFDSDTFSNGSGSVGNYFTGDSAIDDDSNLRINSTIADQLQTQVGIGDYNANLPSPDDLLNLTPLFEDSLTSNSFALLGQSVLPVAYVITTKFSSVIRASDIFDIRPFFRTTELSYNERAGIAGANPPISFANPVVGREEVERNLLDLRDNLQQQINEPIVRAESVAAGTIYGGLRYGVEGPLVNIFCDNNNLSKSNEDDVKEALGQVASWAGDDLPLYAGWDNNDFYFAEGNEVLGTARNHKLFSTVLHGEAGEWNQKGTGGYWQEHGPYRWFNKNTATHGFGTYVAQGGDVHIGTYGALFVKKDISFAELGINIGDSTHYEVNVNMVNCSLMTGLPQGDENTGADVFAGTGWTGAFVEKRKTGFTIFVALGSPIATEGNPWLQKVDPGKVIRGRFTGNATQSIDQVDYMENYDNFDRVLVATSNYLNNGDAYAEDILQGQKGNHLRYEIGGTAFPTHNFYNTEGRAYRPILVTYPTVNFNVIRYDGVSAISRFYGAAPG